MEPMPDEPGQFDTSIEIVTPENIAFRHQVAGPFRRLLAYLVDVLVQGGIAVVGIVVLLMLMSVALFNDVARLLGLH